MAATPPYSVITDAGELTPTPEAESTSHIPKWQSVDLSDNTVPVVVGCVLLVIVVAVLILFFVRRHIRKKRLKVLKASAGAPESGKPLRGGDDDDSEDA